MILPINMEYIVIGDVHGCIDELKTLLAKQDFHCDKTGLIKLTNQNQNRAIVLLGDFIDKSNDNKLKETIEFIYKNYIHLNRKEKRFYLIVGNHEDMVYRYITKRIQNIEKYYNTASLLERENYLKDIFIKLYNFSKTWLYYKYDDNFSVTLTHSPCSEKYLREDDKISKSKMIKCVSRSKNPNISLDELIPFTHTEAKDNQHYHIFGHLSQKDIRKYKNKICIDTSAIYGGSLSCAIIKSDKLSFDSVPFENRQESYRQNSSKLFNF